MKKAIYFLLLSGLFVSCLDERDLAISKPDSATTVSGRYKLTRAYYFSSNILSTFGPGSLTISKVDSNHVTAIQDSSGFIPYTFHWTLNSISNDSIRLDTDGMYGHGKAYLSLADGSLQLAYTKQ